MKNLVHCTDYELVQDYCSGNKTSLEILINRHRKKVFTYIVLVVKERCLAEDIFQDTFIKVIRSLEVGNYKDNGRFISWVVRIAHNLIIDHFRKEKQLKTISKDSFETDIFNSYKLADKPVEDSLVHDQIMNDVKNLLDELPEDQREIIILRHYCDLSFKEIADQTNVSINTALGRMRYALINLRKMIQQKHLCLEFK